jgi:polyphosphate glucokinase
LSDLRLGIDIGGTGMKGALVDVALGTIVGERVKLGTPQPPTPVTVSKAVATIVEALDYEGPVGIGFPSVLNDGWVSTAMNIHESWVGVNARQLFDDATGLKTVVANDADCAALCEATFGTGRGREGLVIVVTFGTGIGSGFLLGGELVPNVELGVIELDGHRPAESYFSAKAKKRDGLSWMEWGARANRFLSHVDRVFSPELIAVGGGVARRWESWRDQIHPGLPVVRATLANNAGIVGAATLVA